MIQNKNTVDLFAAIVKDIKYLYIAEVWGIDFSYWTFSNSPTCNPAVYPDILKYYTEEQITTPHIKLVVDLLVKKNRTI